MLSCFGGIGLYGLLQAIAPRQSVIAPPPQPSPEKEVRPDLLPPERDDG